MNVHLTPMTQTLLSVRDKLVAQRDALLSPLVERMVEHAQELMDAQGSTPRNMLASAWRAAWQMYPGVEPQSGQLIKLVVARIIQEFNLAIDNLTEKLPADLAAPRRVGVPGSLAALDEFFAPEGTRLRSQAMSYEEMVDAGLFVRVFDASQGAEAFRRILSAYRFEIGDYDSTVRDDRVFCAWASLALPHVEDYFVDLLVYDRDAIYGMAEDQEGLVMVRAEGFGTWFFPTVGADRKIGFEPGFRARLESARVIAKVTYNSVMPMSAAEAEAYWSRSTAAACAA